MSTPAPRHASGPPLPLPPRAKSPWRAVVVFLAAVVLLVPIVLPAVLGARTIGGYWTGTPERVPDPPLAEPSVLYAADGVTELATVYLYNRDVVTYDQIHPTVIDALVAVEDVRFYDHPGVDPTGIARALAVLVQGGDQEGGSTLTQQYVKMALAVTGASLGDDQLTSAATENSIWRKVREAKLALGVEDYLSKEQILTAYLNLAYFGSGAYGIQAAAQRYFSTDAAHLTLPQAATLVGLVNNPTTLSPVTNPEGATRRRNLVLDRMVTAGVLTPEQGRDAKNTPLTLVENTTANGCVTGPAPMFCQWVRDELENNPALGQNVTERRARLLQGGLTILTTLDMGAQTLAQDTLRRHVPEDHQVVAAQVLVEPGTGNVKAMAASRPYGTGDGQSVISFATTPVFQPGSTFKAFTLLAALDAHVPVDTRLPGGDRHTSTVFDNPPAGYFTNAGAGYGRNLTLAQATADSVNTAFVQLQERLGTAAVADAAHRAGIASLDPQVVGEREGSLTLGARETSPLEVANAYATIAAHGKACPPRGVLSIRDGDGTELLDQDDPCTWEFAPAVADTVTALLAGVTAEGGSGQRAAVPGHPVAGKTGSTQDNGAAWFAGFTPALAGAVWIGDPRGPSYPLTNMLGQRRVYGGTVPAQIFSDTFTAVLAGTEPQQLPGVNLTYLVTP